MSTLFYDSETTGFITNEADNHPSQPHLVQLGVTLCSGDGVEMCSLDTLVQLPEGVKIPAQATAVHGITTEMCAAYGLPLFSALSVFNNLMKHATVMVAHNGRFDMKVLAASYARIKKDFHEQRMGVHSYCTMEATTNICKLPGQRGKYKWPKLSEAYKFFFDEELSGAHNAMVDTRGCARIYHHISKEPYNLPENGYLYKASML